MFINGKSLYRKQPVQPEVLLRSVAVVDLPHADHHGRNPLQVNTLLSLVKTVNTHLSLVKTVNTRL